MSDISQGTAAVVAATEQRRAALRDLVAALIDDTDAEAVQLHQLLDHLGRGRQRQHHHRRQGQHRDPRSPRPPLPSGTPQRAAAAPDGAATLVIKMHPCAIVQRATVEAHSHT